MARSPTDDLAVPEPRRDESLPASQPCYGPLDPGRVRSFGIGIVVPKRALSHEFWLSPSAYRASAGLSVEIQACVGTGFRGETLPYSPARTVRFEVFSPRSATFRSPRSTAIHPMRVSHCLTRWGPSSHTCRTSRGSNSRRSSSITTLPSRDSMTSWPRGSSLRLHPPVANATADVRSAGSPAPMHPS